MLKETSHEERKCSQAPGTDKEGDWCFLEVYNELGHGFLESVYQKALTLALNSQGLRACGKIEVPVWFRGEKVGDFEADVLVNECLLLELKAVRCLNAAHEAWLLNYLRATEIEVGLLFNFGIKPEFKRLAFDNTRKRQGGRPRLLDALLTPNDEERQR